MRIKKGKLPLFVVALVVVVGSIATLVYQAISSEIDYFTLIIFAVGLVCLEESIGRK